MRKKFLLLIFAFVATIFGMSAINAATLAGSTAKYSIEGKTNIGVGDEEEYKLYITTSATSFSYSGFSVSQGSTSHHSTDTIRSIVHIILSANKDDTRL